MVTHGQKLQYSDKLAARSWYMPIKMKFGMEQNSGTVATVLQWCAKFY